MTDINNPFGSDEDWSSSHLHPSHKVDQGISAEHKVEAGLAFLAGSNTADALEAAERRLQFVEWNTPKFRRLHRKLGHHLENGFIAKNGLPLSHVRDFVSAVVETADRLNGQDHGDLSARDLQIMVWKSRIWRNRPGVCSWCGSKFANAEKSQSDASKQGPELEDECKSKLPELAKSFVEATLEHLRQKNS